MDETPSANWRPGGDSNPRTPPERFTSLVANPESVKNEGIQTTVRRPLDRVPDAEPWLSWSTLPPALKVRENRCEDCGGLGLVAKSTRYTKVHEDGTLNGEPYGDAICRRCDGTGLNLITCQRCGERTLPAMKHAVFCKPCSDALVEEANKPADLSADDLFARIAKNNAWR